MLLYINFKLLITKLHKQHLYINSHIPSVSYFFVCVYSSVINLEYSNYTKLQNY